VKKKIEEIKQFYVIWLRRKIRKEKKNQLFGIPLGSKERDFYLLKWLKL